MHEFYPTAGANALSFGRCPLFHFDDSICNVLGLASNLALSSCQLVAVALSVFLVKVLSEANSIKLRNCERDGVDSEFEEESERQK